MKNLFAPLLSIFLFSNVFAQQPCATTEMPEEMMTWLTNYKSNDLGPFYNKNTDAIVYLPIKVHIVGTDAGGSYHKLGDLLDAFCTLNDQYRPYNWQFYIYDEINYINSTALNNHTGSYNTIINAQSVSNVINMFFVADPDGACGYFSGWGGPQNTSGGGRQGYVAIKNACGLDENTTIAHELGHFFSLPHTFYGWEGRTTADAPTASDERVNGSNCASSGDRFCDTPADFISDRWNCPYNYTKTDYVGTPYNPDGSLYMSYANDACQNHHSDEQLDAMRSYLADRRSYLLNHTFPNYPVITDTVVKVFPVAGATGVPSNYVNLKWREVEGATHYLLQATRSVNINNLVIDTVVTDTSLIFTNLDPGYTYRWRVRPFNKYSTCSPYTIFSTFATTLPTSLNPSISVDPITCNGAFDGAISVNVNGGQAPYNFVWSNGGTNGNLTFVEEGSYLVTITDNASESLVLSIDIAQPDPLVVDLALTGGSLLAQTSGGTAPYSYFWSTGVTTAGIIATAGSTYSVTITDNNGCITSKSFTYTGINAIDAASRLRVYPNPASGASGTFTVEFTVPQALNATIEVVDNAGRQVYTATQDFISGLNVTSIPSSQLSSGIYFVRIVSNDVVKTTKLLVY